MKKLTLLFFIFSIAYGQDEPLNIVQNAQEKMVISCDEYGNVIYKVYDNGIVQVYNSKYSDDAYLNLYIKKETDEYLVAEVNQVISVFTKIFYKNNKGEIFHQTAHVTDDDVILADAYLELRIKEALSKKSRNTSWKNFTCNSISIDG